MHTANITTMIMHCDIVKVTPFQSEMMIAIHRCRSMTRPEIFCIGINGVLVA